MHTDCKRSTRRSGLEAPSVAVLLALGVMLLGDLRRPRRRLPRAEPRGSLRLSMAARSAERGSRVGYLLSHEISSCSTVAIDTHAR